MHEIIHHPFLSRRVPWSLVFASINLRPIGQPDGGRAGVWPAAGLLIARAGSLITFVPCAHAGLGCNQPGRPAYSNWLGDALMFVGFLCLAATRP